jgi:hypothetical protein
MTSDTSDLQPQRSFLSKLRERSAIVFTIGLALSVASFVENLHMGKDAIAYVVAELSKIDGWADAVQAVAAIFHGALEWWRGVLRDLFHFLPFEIPQWMHAPLSIMIFVVFRGLRALSSAERAIELHIDQDDSLSLHSVRRLYVREAAWRTLVTGLLLACLYFIDVLVLSLRSKPSQAAGEIIATVGPYVTIIFLLFYAYYWSQQWITRR